MKLIGRYWPLLVLFLPLAFVGWSARLALPLAFTFSALIIVLHREARQRGIAERALREANSKLHSEVTEREKAEAALKKSQMRYGRISANVPGMVYQILMHPDGSTEFPYFSEGVRGFYHGDLSELMQNPSLLFDQIHPQDRPSFDRGARMSFKEIKPWEWEGRLILPTGEQRWTYGGSRPERLPNGDVIWDGVLMDITERKHAEESLRKSEEYRNLFQLANDSILIFDPQNETVLDVNDHACRLYGLAREDFIGRSLKNMSLDNKSAEEHIVKLLTEGSHEPFETIQFRGDGTPLYLSVSATLISFQERSAILSINRDITARRLAEEALREKTLQLECIAEAMWLFLGGRSIQEAVGVLVRGSLAQTGSEYGFACEIGEDKALRVLADHSLETAEKWNSSEDADGEQSQEEWLESTGLSGLFERVMHSGLAVLSNDLANERLSACAPTGGFLLESFLGVPILKEAEVIGVIGVANRPGGFTENEKVNLELLARMSGVLFDSYKRQQRESALENQLRQVQKMDAVGSLAGGVAHDFNNILTAIAGYSQLIELNHSGDERLLGQIRQIQKASDRAASLTRQLLAFSRKQVLQPKVLNLNTVVADIDKMLKRLIGEDFDLVSCLEPELSYIKADPGQIEQVLMNLVVNARDAMPHGGQITIETTNAVLDACYTRRHASLAPGRYVMLSVSDTGCGMSPEVVSHIFEPFYTTKGPGKGTGLGLSTVYGIVKQSGGTVWVYSEVGKGSAFKIYFPFVEHGRADASESRLDAAKTEGGCETILLVEDDEMVREILKETLTQHGYHVLEAEHSAQAMQLSESYEGAIDLLLTDVVMPQMSGRELVERLAEKRPHLPSIYISGYTDNAVVRHGVLESTAHFLQKPFTSDNLMRKVREVLDARHESGREAMLLRQ